MRNSGCTTFSSIILAPGHKKKVNVHRSGRRFYHLVQRLFRCTATEAALLARPLLFFPVSDHRLHMAWSWVSRVKVRNYQTLIPIVLGVDLDSVSENIAVIANPIKKSMTTSSSIQLKSGTLYPPDPNAAPRHPDDELGQPKAESTHHRRGNGSFTRPPSRRRLPGFCGTSAGVGKSAQGGWRVPASRTPWTRPPESPAPNTTTIFAISFLRPLGSNAEKPGHDAIDSTMTALGSFCCIAISSLCAVYRS